MRFQLLKIKHLPSPPASAAASGSCSYSVKNIKQNTGMYTHIFILLRLNSLCNLSVFILLFNRTTHEGLLLPIICIQFPLCVLTRSLSFFFYTQMVSTSVRKKKKNRLQGAMLIPKIYETNSKTLPAVDKNWIVDKNWSMNFNLKAYASRT